MGAPDQAAAIGFLRGLAVDGERETHISRVFLGADTVWKLKKAVRLTFLDFAAPAQRRLFLQRELALNAPAAPGLYRDVVAIVGAADGTLGFAAPDSAAAIDYVLRMARVPATDFFESLVAGGALTPALLDRTADAVAAFHATLPPAEGAAAPEAIAEGNRLAALQAGLPVMAVAAWYTAMLAALAAGAAWREARARAGFVRRGHGDLHLGNLCLWHGQPTLFDALEFDEAMATADLGYDLAFLLMDLLVRVGPAAANRVLNRYVARSGDAELTAGLPVFLSLRAMVRAHVEAARGLPDALRYLDLSLAVLRPAAPLLVAVGGLQGTGKSTLARALAPALGAAPGALVLRSDEIRKRLAGTAPEDRLPPAAYAPAMNRAVNAALLADAAVTLGGGHAVIADATFLDAAQRDAIGAVAAAAGVPFHGVWLTAPLDELEARVAARRGDASDATPEVLRAAAAAQPVPPGGVWQTVDASDAGTALATVVAALRAHGWA